MPTRQNQGDSLQFADQDGIEPHPTVSVLIPARNEEQFIAQCINSVIATGWPKDRIEILVLDHQSTDATASVARNAGAQVLNASGQKTIGGVRNVGLKAARGEFVAFVDADCTVPTTWLTCAIAMLRSNPNIGAVGGGPALSPSSGTWVERSLAPTHGRSGSIRQTKSLVTYSFIARTALLRDLGNFNDIIVSGEDDDMSNRIRKQGLRLIAASDCRVIHYGFPRTLSQVVRKEMWHGSNHIDVRSDFDLTFVLTLVFIASSLGAASSLLPALIKPTWISCGMLATCVLAQFAPPALFALKKLNRSSWQWSLALPMLVVGYAYFLGHGIGILGNLYRRLVGHHS